MHEGQAQHVESSVRVQGESDKYYHEGGEEERERRRGRERGR